MKLFPWGAWKMIWRRHVFIRMLIIFISIFAGFGTIYQFFYSVGTVRYITFSFDQSLSHTLCNAIEQYCTVFESQGIYNPQLLVDNIPHCFPSICSAALQQFPQQVAMITIQAFKPIVRINDDQILLENQAIVSKEYYKISFIDLLPKITMADPIPTIIDSTVMGAIERCITEKIFDQYLFHIANEHEWYLSDAHDPSLMMCYNSSSLSFDVLQTIYNRLKKQLQKKGPVKTKWVADIRFRDQIILTMGKGGHNG